MYGLSKTGGSAGGQKGIRDLIPAVAGSSGNIHTRSPQRCVPPPAWAVFGVRPPAARTPTSVKCFIIGDGEGCRGEIPNQRHALAARRLRSHGKRGCVLLLSMGPAIARGRHSSHHLRPEFLKILVLSLRKEWGNRPEKLFGNVYVTYERRSFFSL